ncbi:DUF4097 family beta strand repeat-containing protein [Chengkuizengella axinellae]|uniref:DUF4097 family beta strand repeat-containing protein n=1 Tax=Chengkuizengella axinellae TaxID=3064388 RepID=A0ABT9J652_9BACL|nr:DUF4097 family beta strand repeat-containing protein [Chengkuizengella sp. 2205SS18-9]MDP5277096.1 DUF4097 family beta strand repeat-containing protein [Chengkuizengella sp. 2205SS18-9]
MKNFVLLGLILIVVGAIGVVVFLDDVFKTFTIYEEKTISAEQFNKIEIETTSTDVQIIPTVNDEISIIINGEASKKFEDLLKLDVQENGDALEIKLKQKNAFHIGIMINSVDLQVGVPQKLYESFEVEALSGDIEAERLKSEYLNLSVGSGNIEIEGLQSSEVELSTTSGDINAKDGIVTSNMIIDALSGDIEAENITTNSLTMEVSSGDIDSINNIVKSSSYETLSGNIVIYNNELKGDIKAKTTSGDIEIDLEQENESFSFDLRAFSGDVDVKKEGNLFEEKSDSKAIGKVGSGEYIIEANTTSGNITLK